jgi:protoporphyrinogen oxidase
MRKPSADVRQKDTETSLIEQFMYPKLGPGQLWEIVAEKVKATANSTAYASSLGRELQK